jgi:hypothetical protein
MAVTCRDADDLGSGAVLSGSQDYRHNTLLTDCYGLPDLAFLPTLLLFPR